MSRITYNLLYKIAKDEGFILGELPRSNTQGSLIAFYELTKSGKQIFVGPLDSCFSFIAGIMYEREIRNLSNNSLSVAEKLTQR